MRHLLSFIALAGFVAVSSSTSLDAQGKGGGRAHGPKTTATGPKTTGAHGPKVTAAGGPKSAARQGPKTTAARGPKTPTVGGPKTTPVRGLKANGTPKTRTTGPTSTARGNKVKSTPPTTTTTTLTGTTASALPRNPRLVERLRLLLPAGTDMNTAAAGFKNQGQFVAAVHVSNNLGLPFFELKTRMVDQNMSLGQAIQQLRPGIDATDAVRRAARQADDDIADGGAARRRSRQ